MAAPSILKVRTALGLGVTEAAELLQIEVHHYMALENDPDEHFDMDQLVMLWNWMTPKMTNHEEFIKLIDQA